MNILEDLDTYVQRAFEKSSVVAVPLDYEQKYRRLKHAMTQIADCDTMDYEDYEDRYGEDADRDPYVIATKVLEDME